ncbi:MAG: hypothetical protein AABX93_03020 [Nanoarchaeota archaeon]
MAKKVTGKFADSISSESKSQKNSSIDNTLVENFVSLQKVMTNLSLSLDNLSNRMSRLLDLFESSAKSVAERDVEMERRNDELRRKVDNLMEHNKIFAQGLTLLHEKSNSEMPRGYEEQPKPLPKPVQSMQKTMDGDGYQRSISSPKS